MFFALSKIAWFFLQPSNILLALILFGALSVLTRRAQRAGRIALGAGVVGLMIAGYSPLSQMLIAPLENRFARADLSGGPPVSGIIILGGAEDGRAGMAKELAGLNESAERMTEGVALALRLRQARVVFSGGNGHLLRDVPPEAVTAGRLMQALGVEPARIELEDKSRNTWENAVFTKALVQPKPGERWLLVTTAWHMPRAIGCFRAAGFPVEAWPVDYRLGPRISFEDDFVTGIRQLNFIVREYIGLVGYALTGKTSALLPR